jgi:hypothetical protein
MQILQTHLRVGFANTIVALLSMYSLSTSVLVASFVSRLLQRARESGLVCLKIELPENLEVLEDHRRTSP